MAVYFSFFRFLFLLSVYIFIFVQFIHLYLNLQTSKDILWCFRIRYIYITIHMDTQTNYWKYKKCCFRYCTHFQEIGPNTTLCEDFMRHHNVALSRDQLRRAKGSLILLKRVMEYYHHNKKEISDYPLDYYAIGKTYIIFFNFF